MSETVLRWCNTKSFNLRGFEAIKEVIKADGSVEKFDLDKLSKWAKYASKVGEIGVS